MAKTIPHHRHKDSRKQWTDYQPEPADTTFYATAADIQALQAQLKALEDRLAFVELIVCPPKP